MRRSGEAAPSRIPLSAQSSAPASYTQATSSDWHTLRRLFPYLWQYKWRVVIALGCMIAAKVANVGVPVLLKNLVDVMTPNPVTASSGLRPEAVLAVPVALLLGYGLLRLSTALLAELRELVFAEATAGASRRISLEVFEYLHGLSLRFHLERQTGGLTRDIERGTRAVNALISYSLYSIIPTLIEVGLVLGFLAVKFDAWFAWITLVALVVYITFTVVVTEWRTQFRKQMNELDSTAQSRAIDSLLNFETVKYFNNEAFEAKRYDENLDRYRRAAIKSQNTLSFLNAGQQFIVATGLVVMLWRATLGVVAGTMSLGDLVMVNAFMIQLYIPLGFLGVIYRELKQSLTDLEKMFALLEQQREVADAPNAPALRLPTSVGATGAEERTAEGLVHTVSHADVTFDHVHFAYDPARPILHDVSLHIPAGKTVAVVGPSGSGKSTLARLLYRFYDVQQGSIRIAGQDIRQVTQTSLRQAIGIVPQDTVLFNDSVEYNIAYGRPGANRQQVEQAARAARIHDFIAGTPKGYDTAVGERGLKLSGGEKQRVAIARTLLKDPPIMIFDEATSALDSANERAIQGELHTAARNKTTLVIAHRLSTVVDAHEILVMDAGRIIERGTHAELLALGQRYASMWALQQSNQLVEAMTKEASVSVFEG